jgi:glycosyltransferase involved in cell wall biosynthesis
MKVYVLPPNESWIVDRFVKEWYEDNSDISTLDLEQASVIWLLSDWCWRQIDYSLLKRKKVLTTVHHIVKEKFGAAELNDFLERDKITTAYHVYNQHTKAFVENLTKKPVHLVKYWANNKIWKKSHLSIANLKSKYKLPANKYLIGSFQRDTEGAGISRGVFLPKLEKGPDLFADYVENLVKTREDTHVILCGWRRQYLVNRLKDISVPFSYLELPSQDIVNELYQTLDLYVVSSRCEGGPQALIECGLLNVPTISRNVGIATQVLEQDSVNDDLTKALPSVPNVDAMKLPHGYVPYRKLLEAL